MSFAAASGDRPEFRKLDSLDAIQGLLPATLKCEPGSDLDMTYKFCSFGRAEDGSFRDQDLE